MKVELEIAISGLTTRTQGLTLLGLPELEVDVNAELLVPEAKRFLMNMGTELINGSIHLHPGGTVQCGFWPIRFDSCSPGLLSASEPNAANTDFVPGASLALTHWRDQQQTCREQGAAFDPPVFTSAIACSAGVLEGGTPVGGARYRHSDEMSGWFFSTALFDADERVRMHHAHHVTAARPELAKYLALPAGFRFDHGDPSRAWFDPMLEAEEPW